MGCIAVLPPHPVNNRGISSGIPCWPSSLLASSELRPTSGLELASLDDPADVERSPESGLSSPFIWLVLSGDRESSLLCVFNAGLE